jgi:single-stranded DNA-binding protein
MYNKVVLIGTLNCPITTKQINPNLELGTLTLTVERTYTKQGMPFTETSLIDCDLWGKQIEEASKFEPGSTIVVEGRLRSRRVPNVRTGGESVFLSVTVEKIANINEVATTSTEVNEKKLEHFNSPQSGSHNLDPYKQATIDTPEELPF